jgi:hypothetical protein
MGVNDDPNSGYAVMYSGKPSRPGKTQVQIGYGIVAGDGAGCCDTADTVGTGKVKYGAVDGKRKISQDEKQESG